MHLFRCTALHGSDAITESLLPVGLEMRNGGNLCQPYLYWQSAIILV